MIRHLQTGIGFFGARAHASSPSTLKEKLKTAGRFACVAISASTLWWLLAWGAAHALIVRSDLAHADAIVILSGSSAYLERTQKAASLFREKRAPMVILTNDALQGGWSQAQQRNPLFVEREEQELLLAGVPSHQIVVLPQAVSSTHDEAMLLRNYATLNGLKSILVVTSAYHSRRALMIMRDTFSDSGVMVGIEAVSPGADTPTPATWLWDKRGWSTVGGEYLKIAYYWIKY